MPTAAVSAARKPGRPRGPGRINATVRFTPDQYAALRESAEQQGRSVSEEVEARIQESFSAEQAIDRLGNDINQLTELMDKAIAKYQARNEKLQQQVVEAQEKHVHNLTQSTALAERLFQRIADLQKERALDEERLVQMIESAVTRALGEKR